MPLVDYSMSFRGVTIGDGTDVDILLADGLEGMPDVRSGDIARSGVHGLSPGRDLYGGRAIRIDIEIMQDAETLGTTLDDLKAAFSVSSEESELLWKLPGQVERRVLARCRRRPVPIASPNHQLGVQALSVELIATDPLVYASSETVESTAFPEGAEGYTYNRTYPRAYGAAGEGGIVTVDNDGTEDAPWQATITGPWVNPRIEHVATGLMLEFGITVASGETLVIDARDGYRTVLLNGTASRYSTIQAGSTWFKLPPGTNEVRFAGSSGSGTAELRMRSAWA
jgi:hypothetical protein